MSSFEDIKKQYDELLEQLSDPELISDLERFEDLSREKKKIENLLEVHKELNEVKKSIAENKSILNTGDDPDLSSLAEAEIEPLQEKEKELEKELEKLENEDDSVDPGSAIIEIRAGAGGQEAALFAGNLYEMYSKFASSKGWKQKLLDSHPTEIGGFKEVVFSVSGEGAFSDMKYEGGVHRVQRIPETEKSGRIHTSTATVAVLPKPKAKEVNIRPDDLKIDLYKSSGPGGQNVNKRETAVRITHTPTGIVVASQTERNQRANKENAMSILAAKIHEKQIEDQQERIGGKRKEQIGKAKRSEKIRTYNYPQDRITDHRIKKTWHNIEKVMQGDLQEIVETVKDNLEN